MGIFIPSKFYTYFPVEKTVPQGGDRLIYDPAKQTFRVSRGHRLQVRKPDGSSADEWAPCSTGIDSWVAVAKEIATRFNLHLEQSAPTHHGHPIFYLRD